jgi:hypothetical protein
LVFSIAARNLHFDLAGQVGFSGELDLAWLRQQANFSYCRDCPQEDNSEAHGQYA